MKRQKTAHQAVVRRWGDICAMTRAIYRTIEMLGADPNLAYVALDMHVEGEAELVDGSFGRGMNLPIGRDERQSFDGTFRGYRQDEVQQLRWRSPFTDEVITVTRRMSGGWDLVFEGSENSSEFVTIMAAVIVPDHQRVRTL